MKYSNTTPKWWGTRYEYDRNGAYLVRDGMSMIYLMGAPTVAELTSAYDHHLADCGVSYTRKEWPVFPAEEAR